MNLKERLFSTDLILLAGLFLGVVKAGDSLSSIINLPQWLDSLLTLGMCGCYGLHVLLQRRGIKRLIAYGAAAVLFAFSALRSGDMNGLITLLTCIALADCDFDRITKKLLWWNIAVFLINACYSILLALIDGPMGPLTAVYPGRGIMVHLGYGHKNIVAIHLTSIAFLWIWQHFHELKVRQLIVALVAATLFLVPNQCKTTYIIAVWLFLMLLYFIRVKKEVYPLVRTAASLGPAALFAFCVSCVFLYRMGHPFALFISDLLTGRIGLCAKAWEQYGPTFFGHLASDVALVENRVLLMDNLFLYGMVQVGAIWPAAFCLAFFLLARRTKDVRVHLGILLWCLYSMTELTPLNALFFSPSLLISLVLSSRQKDTAITP